MVLQVYVDESISDKPDGAYAMAGYIATAEAWASFSKEWEKLLPLTRRGNSGRFRFKMSEMRHRMDDVRPFYDIICKYALLSVSLCMFRKEVDAAYDRLWSPNSRLIITPEFELHNLIKRQLVHGLYTMWSNPDLIETDKPEIRHIIRSNAEKIDFYFDDDGTGDVLDEFWQANYYDKEHAPNAAGARPRFEDDELFMPLQAADFWAWWVRFAYENNCIKDVREAKFDDWDPKKKVLGLYFSVTEDMIVNSLIEILERNAMTPINVYDKKSESRARTRIMLRDQKRGRLR